ncbi:hypothetical protein SAMN05444161_2705 [Rhizobiales bacterium GAS191]|jgi:hypothetical protein|nr:hypothetical protein SAMN05519104_0617 [Rhizobiales bacterium GAS188]SED18547.1 hypothetical protein SAMN05444161_2705 [Rhizobiales bacterium GAS191]
MQVDAQKDANLRATRRKTDQEERARQVEQRISDEAARRKAMHTKTARLRELRAARDAAEQEATAAAVAMAPAKKPRRGSAATKLGR